nr:unnamed protein product [Digitaria exilis]
MGIVTCYFQPRFPPSSASKPNVTSPQPQDPRH